MNSEEELVLFRRAPANLNRRNLKAFAKVLRDEVTGGQGFLCLITGDRELKRLNRKFRGKDYPTDVLSFPQESNQERGADPLVRGRRPRRPARVTGRKPARGPAADQGVRPTNGSVGEIAISAERAAAQARQYGHSINQEIEILMLHGVLHLLGMDHETDRGRMARVEADWRTRLALPAGLLERVYA